MTKSKGLELKKYQLKKLYLNDKLNTVDISKIFNIHHSTVRYHLKRYDIPIRIHSEAVKENTIKVLLTENDRKRVGGRGIER